MIRGDFKPVGNLGAYKDEMVRFCLKNFFSAENPAGPGSYIHDFKTVVYMKGHMKFGKSKGIERCDLSEKRTVFRHKDEPPGALQPRQSEIVKDEPGPLIYADSVAQKNKCGNISHFKRKRSIGCTWENFRSYNE